MPSPHPKGAPHSEPPTNVLYCYGMKNLHELTRPDGGDNVLQIELEQEEDGRVDCRHSCIARRHVIW